MYIMDYKNKKNIACVLGTRPEIIKMAPVIHTLKKSDWANLTIIATSQHRDIADDMLKFFDIQPDIDFNLMQHGQSLEQLTQKLLACFSDFFQHCSPDAILVQGDTSTVFSAALAASYRHIPIGHIEAGLRSFNLQEPFPEEINRVLTSRLTTWHFVPTHNEKANLLREGINPEKIYVTGNTVIDSLLAVSKISHHFPLPLKLKSDSKKILVTVHRRESWDQSLKDICAALNEIILSDLNIEIIFPVHPNPKIRSVVYELLNQHPGIHLLEPLSYGVFTHLMQQVDLIMSDSGGIQEEAPALGKPVLILRDVTERPEVVRQELAMLVGTQKDKIVNSVFELLTNKAKYQSMQGKFSPYGDGQASKRICRILKSVLVINNRTKNLSSIKTLSLE